MKKNQECGEEGMKKEFIDQESLIPNHKNQNVVKNLNLVLILD